ncbi:MAG: family 20 glycosylhydrolase, partial [Armatimonadetes bacterium]|nr:family 20 glycosylhydrolase [Armatimonadota bacterium]
AVLAHEELKDIREAGNAWVFCSSNPKTWEFLDGVFGELAEQFPNSRYFHIGADEFEDGFGKCPQCQARVNEIGLGGLYAEHLNKLNQICKKHGRSMLFWPSHGASSPDISYLTLKNKDKMERDCIPTEWIYHGPPTYPEIKQYQDAGFRDVWTSPAVVCYSIIYPDYRTTYRGIRGFLRAGREQGVKGTCTTTWEWMYGALFENSWLGMIYACECGWSLGRTSSGEYNRRFAQHWLGITSPDAADHIADTIAEPWPSSGDGAICRSGVLVRDLFWSDPRRVRRQFVMKDGLKPEHSKGITEAAQAALDRLAGLRTAAQRNQRMLDATQLAFLMYRHAGEKLALMDGATEQYSQASRASAGEASATLNSISDKLKQLAAECDGFTEVYGRAVQECGAYKGDLDRLMKLKESYIALATELSSLGDQVKTGKVDRLPPGAKYGFDSGRYIKIGAWQPSQMNEDSCEIRLDITPQLKKAGPITVEWEYTAGAHGVTLLSTTLLADGKPVVNDEHGGWTGSGSHDNAYLLDLKEYDPKAKYEVVGHMKSSGGTDTNGNVWLIVGEGGS